MKISPKFILLIFILFIGSWLVLWDIVDFLTTGLNEGIWNEAIITNAWPSILIGMIIIVVWWKIFHMRIW